MKLRYLTAGESHGPALCGIIEGLPAGIRVEQSDFVSLLQSRRAGYGRGARARIETDEVEVLSGIIGGLTTGSPVALTIRNRDFAKHAAYMHPFTADTESGQICVPLPGHADLAGITRYGLHDCRPVRERASARETAMRVALSVPPRNLLKQLGIRSTCFVESLGGIKAAIDYTAAPEAIAAAVEQNGEDFLTPDAAIIQSWRELTDNCAAQNHSIGGTGAVIFWGLPVGLGSHVHYDRRLDGILAGLVMSIPAVRGVEIGMALELAQASRPAVDQIVAAGGQTSRTSNHAAGLEGGMTNGQPLVIRFHMKPLPGNAGVDSVDLRTGESASPAFYRSDIHAVAAASVVAESVIAIQLASEILSFCGCENMEYLEKRIKTLVDI
ncbi:chorismate synthase [Erysipelotrichia bacterium]